MNTSAVTHQEMEKSVNAKQTVIMLSGSMGMLGGGHGFSLDFEKWGVGVGAVGAPGSRRKWHERRWELLGTVGVSRLLWGVEGVWGNPLPFLRMMPGGESRPSCPRGLLTEPRRPSSGLDMTGLTCLLPHGEVS